MKKRNWLLSVFLFVTSFIVQAEEYHVSIQGNDKNAGTLDTPFRTIGQAARIARPGDVITVHAGTYREQINPLRGGDSPDNPIIYQAATGEKVEIKGSEIIKGWEKQAGNTYQVKIPNCFFGSFNPYADTLHGDWLERGQWSHTGEVYKNGHALTEVPGLDKLFSNKSDTAFWYCQVEKDTTSIWANFDTDPNRVTVEINVRQSVFYPEKPFVNFIHLRGFHLSHAATPWAPPTAEQIGLVGTHWSKGWVIEDNTVCHSKCVGITLGKYGDEWDNKSESAEAFVHTTERALENKWNRQHIGSHTVRNNRISHCGQAGIAGSLGAIFSTIEGNTIFDISQQQQFWGYELAGIKLHAPVDVIIKGNHIYRTEGGIWLDWMTQGTRITGNLLHDNRVQDFSLEVNHGPVLVDNNLFLSEELAQIKLSQGIVFIHNLIAWKIWPTSMSDPRETPYLLPHDTRIAGLHDCPCGDVAYYENVFTHIDLSCYDEAILPVRMSGNLFLGEAHPASAEQAPCILPGFMPEIKVQEKVDGWYLQLNVPKEWAVERKRTFRSTTDFTGALIPNQSFQREGDIPVVFDIDYVGNQRRDDRVCPGPIRFERAGVQELKVYPLID